MRSHTTRKTVKRPFACYEAGQLASIRSRIAAQPELREEYERQVMLSDAYARTEKSLPIHLRGAFRTDPFVFRTPANAGWIRIAIHIRGKGEARIKRLQLTHSERGLSIPLSNGGFAQGLAGWSVTSRASSSSAFLQPSEAPGQGHIFCAENTTHDDWVTLAYAEAVPVRALEHYSIQKMLRLDEPLSLGVFVEVEFLDAAGLPMTMKLTSPPFNRKTPTIWAALLETAGADANVYMVTGDAAYAERAKRKLLYMLPDMCQGMDIFKATGWHVDDNYGAVHIGRGIAVLSVIYDQIADSGVIPQEEDAGIRSHFRYMAGLMMDTGYYRFDLEQFADEKGGKRSNWNADRATCLGIYALVFPEEEQADAYLAHACAVVDWQLDHVVDRDGAWPENIRYHGAVLHRYFLFFTLLQRLRGINYWSRDKVKNMYRFLIGTVTPKDAVHGGPGRASALLSPAVGDSTVDDQWFRLFAYAAPFYANSDSRLSREMMWTWQHGGGVVRDTGAHPCTLLALLYPQPELAQEAPDLASVHYEGIGYVIFRQHFGKWNRENYAIFETSPLTYHAHHDEGHFSLWANGTPLTLDPGTGGYYNGDRHWYVNGHAHNVVQFTDEAGTVQNGPFQSICEEVVFSEQLDYVRSFIPDVNAEAYRRHFAYVKAGADVYIVWDHIRSQRSSVWNLHTMSSSSEVQGNRITAHGLNDMKLEVTFLQPDSLSAATDLGAVSGGYPLAAQEHFRISGDNGNDYLALLYPRSGASSGLTVTVLDSPVDPESSDCRMYKVLRDEQVLFLLLVNGAEHAQAYSVPSRSPVWSLHDKSLHPPDANGHCSIEVAGGRLAILMESISG
ncbi:heparinase II/III family protein [Paenibacillus sp. GCM10023248]|uniref:heparinase II/III domain-containing protein n=1 Tax=unclassified Paenibacillus TaxID=185978 RepID=UPI0023792A0D|nr:heparinase II/III family protein [Paenibacillus sp. MAHUQ-63]MDD9269223.1 heparinase II/III family protein [Paenibacillus sp. MAHUQ-63]